MESLRFPARLARHPDGRKASIPLLDPLVIGYAGLTVGVPIAALAAVYNAAAIRRWRVVAEALAVGLVAWFGFYPFGTLGHELGITAPSLLMFALRVVGLGVAAILAVRQWAHVRGHRVLGGSILPLGWSVFGVLVVYLKLPSEVRYWTLGYLW